jgi:hypothetical protein
MPKSPLRPTLAGLALAMLVVLALPSRDASADAMAEPSTAGVHPIVELALKDVGSYQGQCWPWVKRIVEQATGNVMGFDYRQGFLDAGAAEVSISEAQPGDVIQIARDSDTSPSADYPGLHTSIIVARLAAESFRVVDSNSNWDGMVRIREPYSPGERIASDPLLNFHIYRFPTNPDFVPAVPSTATEPLPDGEKVYVNTPADCLNLRRAPAIAKNIITCMPDNTELTALGGTAVADGYEWIEVASPWGRGWVAAIYVDRDTGTESGGGVAPVGPVRAFLGAASKDGD